MKTFGAGISFVALCVVLTFEARGQLVADGATATINGVNNTLASDLTVGTNGSFTTLIFTNGGSCSNSGNGVIGLNGTAKTNRVIVTGAGSAWFSSGNLLLGEQGSFNSLVVSNGGTVSNNFGNISFNAGSANNSAIVTGANSVWTNAGNVNIGNTGPSNSVIVTNGGLLGSAAAVHVGNASASNQLMVMGGGMVVSDSGGAVGFGNFSSNNLAVVAGAGSIWNSSGDISLGISGSLNQMRVTNGGTVYSVGTYVGASFTQSGSGNGNLLVLSDAGTTWTDFSTFGLGNIGSGNQMSILNGAVFTVQAGFPSLYIATQPGSSNNVLLVSGANSRFFGGSGFLAVGEAGSFNSLVVSNGGGLTDASGYVGQNSTCSRNVAMVTDAGSFWSNSFALIIGAGGTTNQLTISNGAVVAVNGDGNIGYDTNANLNTVVVTGVNSLWTNSGNLYVGNSGASNRLTITNSGTVAVKSNLFLGFASSSTNNVMTVGGGTVVVTNGGAGTIDVRRGTLNQNSGSVTVDQLLVTNGSGNSYILNGGTLLLGRSTVSNGGSFPIGDGTTATVLQLTGNGTNTWVGGARVNNNALITGGGTITGGLSITSGGTLSPGIGIGQMTVTGLLSLSPGSTNNFEINKTLGTNDLITGMSAAAYNGKLVISNLGAALANGDVFKLYGASSYGGSFQSIVPATPGAGLRWSTNELVVDGKLRVVSSPTAIPTIASAGFSDSTHLAIQASGGVPYEPVFLVSAANASLPLTNWTVVLTNVFDASGNAVLTAPVTNSEPSRFYRLEVQ